MDKAKARIEVYRTLPPRHAKGCPKNIMRSAMWQLSTIALTPIERMNIVLAIGEVLPCMCPKAGEEVRIVKEHTATG